jgi:hypothetical protein
LPDDVTCPPVSPSTTEYETTVLVVPATVAVKRTAVPTRAVAVVGLILTVIEGLG